jgi:hypothetical protein
MVGAVSQFCTCLGKCRGGRHHRESFYDEPTFLNHQIGVVDAVVMSIAAFSTL